MLVFLTSHQIICHVSYYGCLISTSKLVLLRTVLLVLFVTSQWSFFFFFFSSPISDKDCEKLLSTDMDFELHWHRYLLLLYGNHSSGLQQIYLFFLNHWNNLSSSLCIFEVKACFSLYPFVLYCSNGEEILHM